MKRNYLEADDRALPSDYETQKAAMERQERDQKKEREKSRARDLQSNQHRYEQATKSLDELQDELAAKKKELATLEKKGAVKRTTSEIQRETEKLNREYQDLNAEIKRDRERVSIWRKMVNSTPEGLKKKEEKAADLRNKMQELTSESIGDKSFDIKMLKSHIDALQTEIIRKRQFISDVGHDVEESEKAKKRFTDYDLYGK